MAKQRVVVRKIKNKIKRKTAIISMVTLGLLAIIYSIRSFIIDLTPKAFAFVGFAIFSVLILEIGIKRLTSISKLKKLGNMQKISLALALTVLVTSIGLFFEYEIPIISNFASGSFFAGGVFIILEAIYFD